MGKGMARKAGFFIVGLVLFVIMTGCRGGGGAPGSAPLAPANVTINFTKITMDPVGNIGWTTSIRVNNNGLPAINVQPVAKISYYDQGLKDLKRATYDPTSLTPVKIETLVSAYDSGRYNSESWSFGESQPATMFYRGYGGVHLSGMTDQDIVLDGNRDFGSFIDSSIIELIGGDAIAAAYTGVTTSNPLNRRSQVRFLMNEKSKGTPVIEIVDDAPGNGGSFAFTSLAQDPLDKTIYIAYRGLHGELRRGSSIRNPDGLVFNVINPRRINPNGVVGQTSLAIGPDGTLELAFNCLDSTGWGICLIERKKGQPETEFRPADGITMMTPNAMVCCADLDGDGLPDIAIAGYKLSTKDLVLLFASGADVLFNPKEYLIDSDGDTGKYAALDVDTAGCLHISYVRADSSNDLEYATNWHPGGCGLPAP